MAEGIKQGNKKIKQKKDRVAWYWNDMIRQGTVNMLVAEQSRGKSMLAMQLVKELVKNNKHGESVLDIPVKAGRVKVLYLSTEMDDELLINRFADLGVNGRIRNIDDYLSFYYQTTLTIEDIKRELKETGAEFVIIDVVSGLIKGMGLDLNSYQDMNDMAGTLRTTFPGITFLLIHHMNKNKKAMGSVGALSSMDTRMEMLETYRETDQDDVTTIFQSIHVYGKSVTDKYIDVAFKYPQFSIVRKEHDDEELDQPLSRLMEEVIINANKDQFGVQKYIEGTYQEVAAKAKMIEKYKFSPKRMANLLQMNRKVLNDNFIFYEIKRKNNGMNLKIWYDPEVTEIIEDEDDEEGQLQIKF